MFNFLAVVLKALLWLLGIGRKKSEAERHEDTAKQLGTLEVTNQDLESALAASESARELETRLRKEQDTKDSQHRKAKANQPLFRLLFYFILPACCVIGMNCAPHHHPPIPPVAVVPSIKPVQIPLPAPPQLPPIIIPEPNKNGYYCFSQAEMDDIVRGIDDLQEYSKKLRKIIEIYNAAQAGKEH